MTMQNYIVRICRRYKQDANEHILNSDNVYYLHETPTVATHVKYF